MLRLHQELILDPKAENHFCEFLVKFLFEVGGEEKSPGGRVVEENIAGVQAGNSEAEENECW